MIKKIFLLSSTIILLFSQAHGIVGPNRPETQVPPPPKTNLRGQASQAWTSARDKAGQLKANIGEKIGNTKTRFREWGQARKENAAQSDLAKKQQELQKAQQRFDDVRDNPVSDKKTQKAAEADLAKKQRDFEGSQQKLEQLQLRRELNKGQERDSLTSQSSKVEKVSPDKEKLEKGFDSSYNSKAERLTDNPPDYEAVVKQRSPKGTEEVSPPSYKDAIYGPPPSYEEAISSS